MIYQTVFGTSRLMHTCFISSFSFFQDEASEDRLSYVYHYVSLINQVFVIRSFTILHGLAQLCFTRVVLDSGDFRK